MSDDYGTIAAKTPDGFIVRRLMPGFSIEHGKRTIAWHVPTWTAAVATVRVEREARRALRWPPPRRPRHDPRP